MFFCCHQRFERRRGLNSNYVFVLFTANPHLLNRHSWNSWLGFLCYLYIGHLIDWACPGLGKYTYFFAYFVLSFKKKKVYNLATVKLSEINMSASVLTWFEVTQLMYRKEPHQHDHFRYTLFQQD